MTGKILVILHQEHSTPGRVGNMLRGRGFKLDMRRPRFGDPLPETMEEHAGAIIFGGPISANDEDGYMRAEIEWVRVALDEEAPFLGICLGAQIMARQLCAPVREHRQGEVEIGYYPIRPTRAGADLAPWPQKVYQWHREGLELPRGATLLAEGDTFACQAFRYGEAAYAVQFHPEVNLAMMHRWTVRGAERLTLPGARPREEHFSERTIHDDANADWLRRLLDRWLASDARHSRHLAAE
ncbi:MAG: glutamine amidotransferase [Hyphomicrobiales bacterium]|nr:glutamine amidotransferase [Hyphomicrobiales bacterium]